MPLPAIHCHEAPLFAGSASTSVSMKKANPSCHGWSRCFTSSEEAIIRTRLCIQPIRQSWRIPASTIG